MGDRYKRIDFRREDDSWKLDAVEKVPQLIHMGKDEAAWKLEQLTDSFFDEPAPEFVLFS